MASLNDSGEVVVCCALCFVQNKLSYVPLDTLSSVVRRGFEAEEVDKAKTLLFEAAAHVTELSHIRKKIRKNTGSRQKFEADVEDILHLLVEADRVKASIPRFATFDINRFPHIPLEEVDGGVVMERVANSLTNEIEEAMKSIKESVSLEVGTVGSDCGVMMTEITSNLRSDLEEITKGISDDLKVLQGKAHEMTTAANMRSKHECSDVEYTWDREECEEEKLETYAERVKYNQRKDQLKSDVATMAGQEDEKPVQGRDGDKDNKRIEKVRDKWTLVESLKRRKVTSVVGSRKDGGSLIGVERKVKDTWDLYVGNIAENVGEEVIADYLRKNGVEPRACYMFSSKVRGTKSARIRVSMEDKERTLMPEFWPEFVRVRSWIIRPRWASQPSSQNTV